MPDLMLCQAGESLRLGDIIPARQSLQSVEIRSCRAAFHDLGSMFSCGLPVVLVVVGIDRQSPQWNCGLVSGAKKKGENNEYLSK
jgi:hypothetical protein